jgi:hypothetical protein
LDGLVVQRDDLVLVVVVLFRAGQALGIDVGLRLGSGFRRVVRAHGRVSMGRGHEARMVLGGSAAVRRPLQCGEAALKRRLVAVARIAQRLQVRLAVVVTAADVVDVVAGPAATPRRVSSGPQASPATTASTAAPVSA